MKIAIGSDHGGFSLKEQIKSWLEDQGHQVQDLGSGSTDSVDYPDFGSEVAFRVAGNQADSGIVVCTTGLGMSIVTNKVPGIRAALCSTPEMAAKARSHNNANILALGQALNSDQDSLAIVEEWFKNDFDGGRHARRIGKISALESGDLLQLKTTDPAIYAAIQKEEERQQEHVELIASENFTSPAVRAAQGSVLTNKYAEGYPGKRWYDGCEFVDDAEQLAIDRAKELFGADHANVQPHSGSGANMAVYFSLLEPGDTVLAMSLADGGHLTHGHKMNFSGRYYNVVPYGVSQETEQIDYDELERLADEHKPKMLLAGASAYPRILDFPRMREIADRNGSLLMVDMAHIAGLVAAGVHPSPVPYADVVTTTTHKTLRGPRGGLVLCREDHAAAIDKQIFPGIQGGPLMHVIAAKAVCLHEALKPDFKTYQQNVVANAQALASRLESHGFRICSGGTDNHLMLVDMTPKDLTGKDAASALSQAAITVNKNAIPFDTRSPFVTSGIRVGTPAVTSRGMGLDEMTLLGDYISETLSDIENASAIESVRERVVDLNLKFPRP